MMTRNDRQEALSVAYVEAVAAVCGMGVTRRVKDYGVDLTLHEVRQQEGRYFESALALDLQVKSTTAAVETRTAIGYDLAVRSYDVLRFESDQERILVVLLLPPDEDEWIRQTPSKLELRQGMYWASLRGLPPVKNRSSVRIRIPKRQAFTPVALRWIMAQIRSGEALP